MNGLHKSRLLTAMLVGLVGGSVGGCGGGSSSSAPSAAASPRLNGVAATGSAIGGAAVTAKCATGTASGTTAADGSFSLVLDGGQTAPCILQATKAGPPAITLYGYASAAGRVNITPLTDMVLARALADSPAVAFSNFDSVHQTAIANGLSAAEIYVRTQMVSSGVGMPTIDVLSGTFAVGDANDRILDVLGTALNAAGKTFDDLRAVAAAGGTVPAVSSTPTPAPTPTPTPAPTPTPSPTPSEMTIAPGLAALTVGTHDISDAGVLAGLAGSHTFGRGIRGEHNHASLTPPAPSLISGCHVSVSGNNLILAGAGQQVSVPLTPSHYNVGSFVIQNITAQVLSPLDLTSRIILNVGTTGGDSVNLTIIDGFVSQATSVDNTGNIYTECGSATGGNQNTDRSVDVLTLPPTFISSLVASASPPASYVRDVTSADLVGVAATINFGRGIYSTYNNDAGHTTKTATLVDDCQVSISNGSMHLSSVAANFDHTFAIYKLGYNPGSSANVAMLSNDTSSITLQGQFRMDLRTDTPVANFANGGDFTAGILSCPLQ